MKKSSLILFVIALMAAILAGPSSAQDGSPAPEPTRINQAIELLEKGQPVYYTSSVGGYGRPTACEHDFRLHQL